MSGCKTCDQPLNPQNKSGYCKRHISAALAQDPAWREKQRNAARMSLRSNPERLDRMRALAVEMGKLPQAVEARRKHCIERELWKVGNASQPKGSAPRIRGGRRQSATKNAWCPPHLLDDYKALTRTGYRAAEARAIIEDQHTVEMARFRRAIGAPEEVSDVAILAAFTEGCDKAMEVVRRAVAVAAPREPFGRALAAAGSIFQLQEDEVLSPSSASHLMPARFAIALALKRGGMSLPVIARSLNRTDHTTAMYWVKRAMERESVDPEFACAVGVIASAWASRGEQRLEAA
ncbi:hypothetical protein [Novosphingobium sp. AP12]|uniref:hypothetical protein n=1 Tax=Novosphingobium sp. AP12 TaxID=1144305 RepID=UPI000271DE0F|nr:hypothetical protein [Novosphingobium sp. AP12]EJL21913.1 hypothetical protein PMI02_04898 [Novosphingobium sp. AP12]